MSDNIEDNIGAMAGDVGNFCMSSCKLVSVLDACRFRLRRSPPLCGLLDCAIACLQVLGTEGLGTALCL